MNHFDWQVIVDSAPYMLQGTVVTLEISACALMLAVILGGFFGLLSVAGPTPVRALIKAYVYFVRGTPTLVQIFLVYFALPRVGFELSGFWSGVVALAFGSAGFIAEIVRRGLQAVDRGQTEAAKAIGMTKRQTTLIVLLPQSIKPIIPALTNELINVLKASSLLSVISITELTRSTQVIIARTFASFELFAALAIYYLVIISLLSWFSECIERRLK